MKDFIPGIRYVMTQESAEEILNKLGPTVLSKPDISRGRRFIDYPAVWEFWMLDGTKILFSYVPGTFLMWAQSKVPDPNRPEPLDERDL